MSQDTNSPESKSVVSLDHFRKTRTATSSQVQNMQSGQSELPPSLEYVMQDIERAHKAQLYYVAVAVALSIPDICSALESDPANPYTTPKSYVHWFDENVAGSFSLLDGLSCYRLRCGVLHQGKGQHSKMEYDRVLFVPPGAMTITEGLSANNGGRAERVLMLGTSTFCTKMIEAGRTWYDRNRSSSNVQANMPNVVRYRPEGFAPHIVGFPVIG